MLILSKKISPQVEEVFKGFGDVTSTMLQKDKLGRPFAFINYESTDMAKKAIAEMHMKVMLFHIY
jgi:RNA recognition motif-containing protein